MSSGKTLESTFVSWLFTHLPLFGPDLTSSVHTSTCSMESLKRCSDGGLWPVSLTKFSLSCVWQLGEGPPLWRGYNDRDDLSSGAAPLVSRHPGLGGGIPANVCKCSCCHSLWAFTDKCVLWWQKPFHHLEQGMTYQNIIPICPRAYRGITHFGPLL